MKHILTILALSACTLAVTSCKKNYKCRCVDPTGQVIEQSFSASNKKEAKTNCTNVSKISECELE